MRSAGCPTSAAVPADSTMAENPSVLSRCARSASAIGLRQMLPVHTMRMRLNTASWAPRAQAPAGAQSKRLVSRFGEPVEVGSFRGDQRDARNLRPRIWRVTGTRGAAFRGVVSALTHRAILCDEGRAVGQGAEAIGQHDADGRSN